MPRHAHRIVHFAYVEVIPVRPDTFLAPNIGAFVWVAAVSRQLAEFEKKARRAMAEWELTVVRIRNARSTRDRAELTDEDLRDLVRLAVEHPRDAAYDEFVVYEHDDDHD